MLKPKHSLLGKSLFPVIMELKSNQPGMQIDTFERLKKDHPLEKYSLEELKVEFNRLTGETIQSLLIILSQEESVDLVRKIMHFSILHANNVGAPKGQVLTEIAPSAAGSSGSCTGNGDGAANLEDRLKGLEQNVSVLKSKSGEQKVDDAIRQVRLLAARPKLTPSHVLIASLEMLVDVAKCEGHKDAEFFNKALQACRRFEESEDVCGLCLKLIGSSEDRKISTAIAEWVKGKKYDKENEKEKVKETNVSNVPSFPYLAPMYNNFPLGFVPPMPMPGYIGFGQGRGGNRARNGQNSNPRVCYFCKEKGHFVAACPKIKKE